MDWLYSGAKYGATERLREIFDASYRVTASAAAGYPVMPFAWPVLGTFRALWNGNGYVTDGYTGSWNAVSGLPA
jgi:hypothetical protein